MKTPLNRLMNNLPPKLMEAVEKELAQTQSAKIRTHSTRPFYQLASQALDNIEPNPALTTHELVNFLQTDTLLYVSPADPSAYHRQLDVWTPLHQWVQDHLGIIIPLTETISPPPVCEASIIGLKNYLSAQSIFALAGIQAATHTAASIIIAILMREGAIDAQNAFKACLLEELTQNAKWGTDELAQARQDQILADLTVIESYFSMIK